MGKLRKRGIHVYASNIAMADSCASYIESVRHRYRLWPDIRSASGCTDSEVKYGHDFGCIMHVAYVIFTHSRLILQILDCSVGILEESAETV